MLRVYTFFISNLVAKAPGLNLGENLSNLLNPSKQCTREIFVS